MSTISHMGMTNLILNLILAYSTLTHYSDACPLNLMMDETRVVPKGSHFADSESHDGTDSHFTRQHRCTVAPVHYYYIDFGLSKWHPNGHENVIAIGVVRQLKDIPDLSDTVPYNPFKLDICQLGRTIPEIIEVCDYKIRDLTYSLNIKQVYSDLSIFTPWAQKMMHPDPKARPTATESLAGLEIVVSSISARRLRTRI